MIGKIRELERRVLPQIPEEGTTKITWENGNLDLDRAEYELYKRAQDIWKRHEEIIEEIDYNLKHGLPNNPVLTPTLSPTDTAIIDTAHKRFMYRLLQIVKAFGEAIVYQGDKLGKFIFFQRLHWIIEDTQKAIENWNAEQAVFDSPGFFDLCMGEQDRLLAPVYAKMHKDLFTPKSWEYFCNEHPITKPIKEKYAAMTPEQIEKEEKEEAQREAEETAKDEKYLREKCPTCKQKCTFYLEATLNRGLK